VVIGFNSSSSPAWFSLLVLAIILIGSIYAARWSFGPVWLSVYVAVVMMVWRYAEKLGRIAFCFGFEFGLVLDLALDGFSVSFSYGFCLDWFLLFLI
jgi:hypothetical protein